MVQYLTMYRNQYESRLIDSAYHEEVPFFREAVTLIDHCTKLPKDDRILLRNKIKDYLRRLRENKAQESEDEHEQFQQIMQIFVEANKKKSLAKIQREDKVMDWLQIKLRKLVDSAKKQRHKRELQNFRKGKFINIKKSLDLSSINDPQMTLNRDKGEVQALGISKQYNHPAHIRSLAAHSLSRSQEKSQVESSRSRSKNSSYADYSYHKQFSFLRKERGVDPGPIKNGKAHLNIASSRSKHKETSRSKEKEVVRRPSNANKSADRLSKFNFAFNLTKIKDSSALNPNKPQHSRRPGNQVPKAAINSDNPQSQIDQLTKLFTQQLKADHSKTTNQLPFRRPNFDLQFNPQPSTRKSPPSFAPEQVMNTSHSRFEESNKKLSEMLQGSKTLFEQLNTNYQPSITFKASHPVASDLPNNPSAILPADRTKGNYDNLFTPPDFLAECRKFLSSSSKKRESEDQSGRDLVFAEQRESGKKLTFSNLLSDSHQKQGNQGEVPLMGHFEGGSPLTQLAQLNINEVVSENPSVNISTKKPFSEMRFSFKAGSIILSVPQLLEQIFVSGAHVSLDKYQLGQLMARCQPEPEQFLQEYCDGLPSRHLDRLQLDFIGMVKSAYSQGLALTDNEEHFADYLLSILDMKRNGFIDVPSIENFIGSLEHSEIEGVLLSEIESLLTGVFEKSCRIEGGGTVATRWSLYYLELKQDPQMEALQEVLNRFDFQIDNEDQE